MPRPRPLRAATVAVRDLDGATRNAMWDLFGRYYEGTTRATFDHDLDAKDEVILVRDSAGMLQGFSTLVRTVGRHRGRRYVALFSGDTVLERAHWGDGALQRAFGRALLSTKLRHPGRRAYWFLISKGYKTYLLLARNFPEHWPRRGQATPSWEASLLDHLARQRFGEAWDARQGIVRIPGEGKLRQGIAPAEGATLQDPDVAYFVQANPQHGDGDELACLGRIRPWLPLRYVLRRRRHKRGS